MDDSGDSNTFSDVFSSFSEETSDLLESDSRWSSNNSHPSQLHLPPFSPSIQPIPLQRHRSTRSPRHPVHSQRESQARRDPVFTRRLPEPHPFIHTPQSSREPAHFQLPDFPLPTADRRNRPLPYTGDTDSLFGDIQDWSDWDNRQISPLSRPASRISWGSSNSWGGNPFDSNDIIDLTEAISPSDMPAAGTKRRTTSKSVPRAVDGPSKRQRTNAGTAEPSAVKNESDIQEVDLRDVDDDDQLTQALQKQQEAAIKAQHKKEGEKPTKLSGLQCIICLETMKDVTATNCGHLFCHGCLMEALIAGERQETEPGKYLSRCPVCRKKVSRPKPGRPKSDVIPLEIKFKSKGQLAAEKLKVTIKD